jgi:hypothetical protein
MRILLILFNLLLLNSCGFKWSSYFEFTNELNIPIDSIRIVIGDKENWVTYKDSSWVTKSDSSLVLVFGKNLSVPDKGYPHRVDIDVYSGVDVISLEADSFDCYNCDGSHEYILQDKKATYKFHN